MLNQDSVIVSVALSPDTLRKIDALAEEAGKTREKAIQSLLDNLPVEDTEHRIMISVFRVLVEAESSKIRRELTGMESVFCQKITHSGLS